MRISDWSSDVCSSDLLGHQLVEADRSMLDPAARPILARVCADNWWHRHSTTVGYAVAKHFTLIRWPRWRRLRSRGYGTDLGLAADDADGNVLIVAIGNIEHALRGCDFAGAGPHPEWSSV